MKTFMVLLVLAYVRSEKLDLKYLPPPGSQYAGGRPEDIQVPLEFPKETYTNTIRPQDFDSGITSPENYQATIGINRGLPTDTLDASDVTPGSNAPSSFFQNTYKVPTTTVSYAFTQTTTHPPIEAFETTIGPQFAGTGIPSQDSFNNFQPQEPSLIYQGNLDQPGYKKTQFGGQNPTAGPLIQYPGYPTQQGPVTKGENRQAPNRPVLQQNVGQFDGQRPTATSSPISQFTGSIAQPQGTGAIYEKDLQAQNRPGYKPIGHQFREQIPTFAPTSGPVNKFPIIPQQNLGIVGENLYGQQPNNLNQPRPGYQQTISEVHSGVPFGQTQHQNQSLNEGGLVNQPGFVPSTISPQGYYSTTIPGIMYGNRVNNIQGSLIPHPNAPQTGSPNQIGAGQIINYEEAYKEQLGSQINSEPAINGNIGPQPMSTVAPTAFSPGIQNGQFSTGSSVDPGSYATVAYPGYNQVGGAPGISYQRPERPQADTDRNAVILNYENVITPERFTYSFDTSNGIHADESGTATDGVKAKGSYSYIGDDGKLYSVVYTADENGYQPHGDHLPTPPPIPEAIQEIIEKVKKEKEAGIYHDGFYDDDKYGDKKYNGAMGYGSQGPKNVIVDGAEIPDEYIAETALEHMKSRRPLTGSRIPIASSGDLSDFDLADQEYSNDDYETPDQISTQRPINHFPGKKGKEKNGSIQDGENQYIIEVSSKRPSNQPIRKLINKIKSTSGDDPKVDGDKRHPGDKIGSQQIENQASYKYGSDEPYYKDDDSNIQFSNKAPSKSSTNQQRPQYGQDDTAEFDNSSIRPLTPGSFKRPVINAPENINKQTSDEYGTTRPTNQLPGRRPANKPVIGIIQNQFQPDERYNIQKGSSRPSNKPNEYVDEDDSRTITSDYKNEEYVTKSPSRIQPYGTKPSLTSTSQDQSTRRQPAYIPKTPNAQNQDVEYQQEDDEKYIGSSRFKNIPSQKYGNHHPGTDNTFGDQYEETGQLSNDHIPEGSYYNIPQPTSSEKYDRTRGRPQISGPRGRPQSPFQETQLIDDNKSNDPGAKFGQKLIRPTVSQENNQVENDDYNQQPVNETGYQYIPPRRKFEQNEVKGFPNKYSPTIKVSSTRRPPQQKVFYETEDVKSKPFMTPNVSRDDTNLTDDEYDEEPGTLEMIPGKNQKQQNRFNTEYSQYPDGGTNSNQIFDDEIISSNKPPSEYINSNYSPSPTMGRPLRPEYNEYTQNAPGVPTSVAQKENLNPIQAIDRFNGHKYTKAPYGGVSSTTPFPSTKPYYGPTTPEEQNNYVTGNTYQTPEQGIISSTTPLPSQKPNFEGFYQQNNNDPQYQPTFRPAAELRPTTEYLDGTTAQRLPTVSSTYSMSSIKSTKYGSDLPSTTYRPNYTIPGSNEPITNAIPDIIVDGFGRPVRPGYSSTDQDYTSGSTHSGRDQKFQSSTQKIIGEDFSGPKQQQKFDPKTGYYYK